MAELQTKWINVGTDSGFVSQYGFGQAAASSNSTEFGSIANSEDGTRNVNLDSVYSGADVRSFVFVALSGYESTTLTLTGNRANSGWDTVSIGNSTLNRSDATYSYNSNLNFTTWNWSGSTNYFGTTNNDDYEIVFDDGVAATPTAPTDITFGPDPGTYDDQVSITATASGGTNGTMKVSANGTTWVANGSSFTFTRGTAKTIYARTEGTGSNSSNYSESHTVGYLSPDLNVSVSRSPSGDLAHNYTGNVVVTISNGTANNRYRVLRTTGGNSGKGNTGILTGTSGTVTLHNADANDLPSAGNTVNYVIQGRVDTTKGGNNSYSNTNASFSITRSSTPIPTYSINAPASINEGSAGTINVTTTNVSNGTTLYWDLDLTDDYSTTQGTVTINSNAGSFTITPSADSSTEGAETDTIRLYSDSGRTTQVATDSFTVNDTSTGSGGSDGGSDGSSTYGVEVTGPNGTTTVFGSSLRQMNAVLLATATLGSSGSVSYTGIAEATDSSKIAVVVAKSNPSYFSNQGVTVTRSTASGGTITLTNVSTSSVTIKVSIYRIS